MELAFWFFDPPPPIFRVLSSFFYIPWAHGTTRYMCRNGCFGGVFLVCHVMLTIMDSMLLLYVCDKCSPFPKV